MNILLLILPLMTYGFQTKKIPIGEVRTLYIKSAAERDSAEKLNILLAGVDTASPPLLVCYEGAAIMMTAKYALNPINKFAAFKHGRALIEWAVNRDSLNIENRFIRFSVQSNLPGFLKYDQNIEADKKALINGMPSVCDADFKNLMINYLGGSKYFTQQDLKKLKQ